VAWTYSRIDTHSGAYRILGSIERVSRYLDDIGDALFDANVEVDDLLEGVGTAAAAAHPAFAGLSRDEVESLLRSAKRVELLTRHKANPNIPELGTRQHLVDVGILSNKLPTDS
jgi:hypothetical protein